MPGEFDKVLQGLVDTESIHLLGLAIPPGSKGVPSNMLQLIRSAKSAVLLHRDRL